MLRINMLPNKIIISIVRLDLIFFTPSKSINIPIEINKDKNAERELVRTRPSRIVNAEAVKKIFWKPFDDRASVIEKGMVIARKAPSQLGCPKVEKILSVG